MLELWRDSLDRSYRTYLPDTRHIQKLASSGFATVGPVVMITYPSMRAEQATPDGSEHKWMGRVLNVGSTTAGRSVKRATGDIATHLFALKLNHASGLICRSDRPFQLFCHRCYRQNSPPVCNQLTIA